jgi:cation diffusion facilitator CzcD-associated flavoprotein CzcO
MSDSKSGTVDAVVVGAGFAGVYLLYRLRAAGMILRSFEANADVDGTNGNRQDSVLSLPKRLFREGEG